MKNLAIILTFTILFFTSCSKKDDEPQIPIDQLPAITTIGANTAGCIINGLILVPKNGSQSIGGAAINGLNLIKGNNFWPNKNDYWQLEIANKKDVNGLGIFLWIKNMQNGNGDYNIGQSNGELYADGPNNNQLIAGVSINGINKTFYSSVNSGMIKIIRSDLATGISIYSGTFSGILYNKDNKTETIQISEGRFDINNLTLNK